MKRLTGFLALVILLVALPAIGDTETQLPTSIFTSSGVGSGTVADIDEDIDSPDANWIIVSGNNVDLIVGTDFNTPTGNPSGTNTCRAWVREFDSGQTGTATATVHLYENGVTVSSTGPANITSSTGEEFSHSWDASELGTADGSLVQCYVHIVKSGGSPGVRQSGDIGSINWDVNYSTGPAIRNSGNGPGFGGVGCCEKDR